MMREDKQILTITHLSQLLNLITGLGGIVVPLLIWLLKKEEILGLDTHGKMILNFQISMVIYSIICIPLIFAFGLGVVLLLLLALMQLIFPIINAIRVSNNQIPDYPISIPFLK